MSDPYSREELIRRIHAASGQMVLVVTGGGSRAISDLLGIPGGSRTILEAIVPYSAAALIDFLHGQPEHFCSAPGARSMAMAAFERARYLQSVERRRADASGTTEDSPVFGIACTASLVSDRPKRGAHRIHVACQSATTTTTQSVELIKGQRTRAEEEAVAADLVLKAIAEALQLDSLPKILLSDDESILQERTNAPRPWQELLLGQSRTVYCGVDERSTHPRAIFPGAFNPLHSAHERMAEIAAQILGIPAHFEISIQNVDKPLLDYTEIETRAKQFTEKRLPLWLTRAPTFVEKAALFPGASFIVGADTLARIGHCRYYGHDPAAVDAAMQQIAQHGCRFLVFGRLVNSQFGSLADLELPTSLRKMCDEVPASQFREDISSTELRKRKNEE
jgi:hypothetical protein